MQITPIACPPRAQRKAHASWQKAQQATEEGVEAAKAEPPRVPAEAGPAQRAPAELLSLQLLLELTQVTTSGSTVPTVSPPQAVRRLYVPGSGPA